MYLHLQVFQVLSSAQNWGNPLSVLSQVVDTGYAAGPVLSSYLGNLYRRYFFDAAVQHPEAAHAMCRLHDDMWSAQPATRTTLFAGSIEAQPPLRAGSWRCGP